MNQTVTIHDVARRAGVSIATVSRVLNKTAPVAEEKRRRVEEAVRELGYTPNPAARSLLKKETGGIGVLLPFVAGEFFAQFLTGTEYRAYERGYYLMVSSSHYRSEELGEAIRRFMYRVDGLIIMAPETPTDRVVELLPPGMPVVFVNSPYQGPCCDVINFDNFKGAYQMTRHLIEQGARRIAHIRGKEGAFDARERHRGYRQALLDAGLALEPRLEVQGDFTQESGYEAMKALLTGGVSPEALFAANDYMAIGAMAALREHGVRIPEDILVGGFDDVTSARFTDPPLSTVHVPVETIGRRAVDRLIERITAEEPFPAVQEMIPVSLVVRASTERNA